MSRPATSWWTSAALILAGASLALAQAPEERDGYRRIRAHQLASTTVGGRYTIAYLKFNKVFETELKVYGGQRGKRTLRSRLAGLLRVKDDSKLQSALLARKDSEGRSLQPKESNIQVFGTVRLQGQTRLLDVDRVVLVESQLKRFERQSQGLPEGDSKARRELVRLMDYATRYFPEDQAALKPLRERLIEEARQIVRAKLPELPGGAARRIEVGLAQRDLDLISEVWSHPEVDAGVRAKAEEALVKLRATRYHGEWIPITRLKDQLGFLVRDRRWVRQERVWLEEAIEREKQRLSSGQSRRDYTRSDLLGHMRKGKILRGMEREWVIAARKSAGKSTIYPRRVERIREKRDTKEFLWELWIMPDGEQIYFFNGWVTERVEAEEEEQDEDEAAAPEEGEGDSEAPDSEPAKTGE